ncbi:MAG: hypothetical protein ACPF9R_01910 [Acholeplasmataceae bacterium]
MHKKLIIIYGVFVIYSIVSLAFNRPVTLDFMTLFTFQGDMLLVMVFNMLGVFPVYYILVASTYEKQKTYVYGLYGLSFMFGAFATIPALLLTKGSQKPLSKFQKRGFIVLPIMLLLMTIVGILFGNIRDYYQFFLNDQFVHIMTIDFIILLITPYFLGADGIPFKHLMTWHL